MTEPTSAHFVTTTDAASGTTGTNRIDNTYAPTYDSTVNNSTRDQIEPVTGTGTGTGTGEAPSYTTSSDDPRRPSVQEAEAAMAEADRRDSLAPTPNPMNPDAITTEDATSDQIPPSSSVGTQNAPGAGGKIGEAVMGGFGYGGSSVERPKEEQGIAEKIVNILGA